MAGKTLHLYDATDALLIVREWIEENQDALLANDGELPPELAELIDKSSADFEKKVEAVGLFVRELEATRTGTKSEADRMAQRAKTLGNTVDGLKRYLEQQLARAEVKDVKGKLCTVRRQKNGQPSVLALPPVESLPAEYVRTPAPPPPPAPEADRAKLVLAYKEGLSLPAGVEIVTGFHVRIS